MSRQGGHRKEEKKLKSFYHANAAHMGRTNALAAAICGEAGVDVPAYDAGTEVTLADGFAIVSTDGSRSNAGSYVDSGRIYTRSGYYCQMAINAEELETLTAIGDAGAAAGMAEFDSRQAPPVVESRTRAELDAADGDLDGDDEPGSAPCEADEPGWSEDDPTRWRGSAAAAPTCGGDAGAAAGIAEFDSRQAPPVVESRTRADWRGSAAAAFGRTNALAAAICGVAGVDVPAYDAWTEVTLADGFAIVSTDGSRRNAGSFVDSGRIYTRSGNYCRIEINAEELATLTAIGDAGAAAGIAEFEARQALKVEAARISCYYRQRKIQREKLHKLSRVVAPKRVAEAQRKYDKGKAGRCSAYHLKNLNDAMAWQVAIDRRYAELVRRGNELD